MNNSVEIPMLLTVKEVAAACRCSRSQAYNLIADGAIPKMTVAGKTLCRAADVKRYLDQCATDSGLSGGVEGSMKPFDTSPPPKESGVLSAQRRSRRLAISSAR